MQCISPINIPRPGGAGAQDRIVVPCGKCAACLTNRRNEWANRLKEELDSSDTAFFVTLTYNDSSIPVTGDGVYTLVKSDLQNYLKRLRSVLDTKIRYYAVGEYGTITHRPHYHIIIFNVPLHSVNYISQKWSDENGEKGFVLVGSVTGASIYYVSKYHVNRTDFPDGAEPSFCLMSKGIGRQYIDKYAAYHRNNIDRTYIPGKGGIKSRLPRYYKNKLYTEDQRKAIARKFEQEYSGRVFDQEAIDEFYRLNPEGLNYFEYDVMKKENFQKNFKTKVNKKNQL